MEPHFADNCRSLTEKLHALREPDDLCFALLAGTAVSDFADHTDENIRAVDAQTHFDGVIHLGDILNGSIPENASRFVLSQELARFQNATASGKLYIACGDDDGFRNERYVGQIVTGIVTDERWYEETAYLESYVNLHRPRNKPYYFVDFYDRKMRLIFLSSHLPQIDEQEELFEKSCQYGVEQLAWLKTEALQLPEGWAIFLFSHALPKSRFETGTDPWNYMEYASEPAMMLLRQAQKHGIRIGGWFAGHYACDYETTFCHIPYFLIDSVRPQPIKSLFPNVRKCTERGLGAETEDLWDVLLLKPNQRRIYLLRFGAGEVYGDNVIEKHGINRDRTGDREKTRYLCGKQGIFTRDRALIRPGFIRQLETRASTRSASFFHALGSPGRPHNGGGAAGAYCTSNGAKPLKQGHFRAKRGPLGPSRKSQQQTKRTGFAAHGHSIAETAPEGKRASCANGALIRA